jgi:hypothetical protein
MTRFDQRLASQPDAAAINHALCRLWMHHRADPDIAVVPMTLACRLMRRVMPRRAFRRWRGLARAIRKTGSVV